MQAQKEAAAAVIANIVAASNGKSAGEAIVEEYSELNISQDSENIELLFNELKTTMNQNVGIVRDNVSLNNAIFDIKQISIKLSGLNSEFNYKKHELKNALCVANLVAKAALDRLDSIGAHFRIDSKNQEITTKGLDNYDKTLVK